MIKAPKSVLY